MPRKLGGLGVDQDACGWTKATTDQDRERSPLRGLQRSDSRVIMGPFARLYGLEKSRRGARTKMADGVVGNSWRDPTRCSHQTQSSSRHRTGESGKDHSRATSGALAPGEEPEGQVTAKDLIWPGKTGLSRTCSLALKFFTILNDASSTHHGPAEYLIETAVR